MAKKVQKSIVAKFTVVMEFAEYDDIPNDRQFKDLVDYIRQDGTVTVAELELIHPMKKDFTLI